MKRILTIVLAMTLGTSAFAESYVGTWSAGSSVGLPRCSEDDDNKVVLTSNSEQGYEHQCKFVRKQQIGANSWRISASCHGEGEAYKASYTLIVKGNSLIRKVDGLPTSVMQRCAQR